MRFELVIFDNDGVLVDSEVIACDVLAQVLTDLGVPTTFDDVVQRYLGSSIERTRGIVEAELGRPLDADVAELFHQGIFERYESELKPVVGVEDVIASLHVPFCVASSGTHERIRHSLSLVGLLDHFEGHIFSAADVTHGKPEPDLFLLAADRMDVAPERCVVIEDSPLGLMAAHGAGMASIGFAGLQPAEKLSGASEGVVSSMSELLVRFQQPVPPR